VFVELMERNTQSISLSLYIRNRSERIFAALKQKKRKKCILSRVNTKVLGGLILGLVIIGSLLLVRYYWLVIFIIS
jgi:hypothetical protein